MVCTMMLDLTARCIVLEHLHYGTIHTPIDYDIDHLEYVSAHDPDLDFYHVVCLVPMLVYHAVVCAVAHVLG